MSFLGKKWIVKNTAQEKTLLEKILENRGISDIDAGVISHDPFLFEDMNKSINRVKKAIDSQERIIVFGDYDVDGISGAAILITTLNKLGANVSYRLPHRVKDGYGLSEKFIDEFVEKNVNLLITVDCGISSNKEIKKAKESSIDVIITDHHTIPEELTSDAFAILHPKLKDSKYPYSHLTGAGVALKFAQALLKDHAEKDYIDELIALASLGTVADLGPLKGENRYIVKQGLANLSNTKLSGLKKLIELAGRKKQENIDTYTIGFRIAPRINAAGRIGDPYLALSLLLQGKDSEKVDSLGQQLENLNTERQEMTAQAVSQAEIHFANKGSLSSISIASNPDWHVGILGLVASRIAEKYNRPAIIMQDLGDVLVASARSPKFFNITEGLTQFGDQLISFGGHAQAAGFNIKKENLDGFRKSMELYAEERLKDLELIPALEIDSEIGDDDINFETIDSLSSLEPFGIGNEKPIFLLKNVEPYFVGQVGKEKNHLKFVVKSSGKDIHVIGFNLGDFANEVRGLKSIDLVCNLEKNTWNNRDNIQLRIIDIRESK